MRIAVVCAWAAALCVRGVCAQDVEPPAPDAEITPIAGNLYQIRSGRQYSILLATADGILLGDPLNAKTALWLQQELARRFPGRPVKYVVLSHHHFDRAEAASVFAPTAEIVGHRLFNRELENARAKRLVPPFLGGVDANHNGTFEPDEIRRADLADLFADKDRNHDGVVDVAELYSRVMLVKSTYDVRRTIALGNSTIELLNPGAAHTADMTVLFFTDERIVFAVDPPPIDVEPFSFGNLAARHLVSWLDTIASLDADTIRTGDGRTFSRQQLMAFREYAEAMVRGVIAEFRNGRTLTQLQAGTMVDAFRHSPQYAGRHEQIESVYRSLRSRRAEISATALTAYAVRDSSYCAEVTLCRAGGTVPGGSVALTISIGERFGVVAEVTSDGQMWGSRASRFTDDEVAARLTSGALMLRYRVMRAGRFSVAVLGGGAETVADARGMERVKEAIAPFGGVHAIGARQWWFGLHGGIDASVALNHRFRIVVPVRVAGTTEDLPDFWPTRVQVRAGVGFAVTVLHQVE